MNRRVNTLVYDGLTWPSYPRRLSSQGVDDLRKFLIYSRYPWISSDQTCKNTCPHSKVEDGNNIESQRIAKNHIFYIIKIRRYVQIKYVLISIYIKVMFCRQFTESGVMNMNIVHYFN